MHRLPAIAATLVLATTTGCASASGTGATADPSGLTVAAGFYPLQFISERVAGDAAAVTNLTPQGGQPHDLELTPSQVAELGQADLVVYLGGFAPAVDAAVAAERPDNAYDVAPDARLIPLPDDHEHGDDHDHGHGLDGLDPHFWLDPLRVADVADALAERLAEIDPAGANGFARNADALRAELTALDEQFRAGTTDCENRYLVVSHEAFGYLGAEYNLDQVGIAGINPDQEPSAGTLAKISDFVADNGITTVYSEVLVSPAVAQTIAAEAGAEVRVLDPIEGITDASAADDYLGLMEANLAELRAGQPCR